MPSEQSALSLLVPKSVEMLARYRHRCSATSTHRHRTALLQPAGSAYSAICAPCPCLGDRFPPSEETTHDDADAASSTHFAASGNGQSRTLLYATVSGLPRVVFAADCLTGYPIGRLALDIAPYTGPAAQNRQIGDQHCLTRIPYSTSESRWLRGWDSNPRQTD